MAKFAPVAPIQVLEGLWAAGPQVFGDYHLLLAHHTVEHRARFADLFKRIGYSGWKGTIIMDNSIVELGNAVDPHMIAEAVFTIKNNAPDVTVYPVLPDLMGNGFQTREAVSSAYADWAEGMPGDGFMAVVQGADIDDYIESLNFFTAENAFPKINVLGIPRILHKTCGSRVHPMRLARKHSDKYVIHMLGFSDVITDDVDASCMVPGCGIDSAVPLRMQDIFSEFADPGKRPPTWFNDAQVNKRMIENLDIARVLFRGPQTA